MDASLNDRRRGVFGAFGGGEGTDVYDVKRRSYVDGVSRREERIGALGGGGGSFGLQIIRCEETALFCYSRVETHRAVAANHKSADLAVDHVADDVF